MRVFILSLLAAVSSVYSHAIHRYPYHSQLLTYSPARGEFPVYNNLALGYLRYFDNNGIEHSLRYDYPEPLYGVRRYVGYQSGPNQLIRTASYPETGFNAESYYQLQDSLEVSKAREEHFRRWCEQRYKALKAEMDKLYAEGQRPSGDMMAQLQPLEKIIHSTTYTALTESPEIKRIRDEHLRIWNEARLKVLQQEANHLRFNYGQQTKINEVKTNVAGAGIITDVAGIVGETEEQKKAREEHLRIYNEQLLRVKQQETEQAAQQQSEVGVLSVKATQPELILQQPNINFELKTSLPQEQQQSIQVQGQVMDTPEVIRAREEHLRLVNEAKLRAQAEGNYNTNDDGSYKPEQTEINMGLKFIPGIQQPVQPIQNIAIVQTAQPIQQAIQQQEQMNLLRTTTTDLGQQQPVPVQETPEVMRAREEHLKVFNQVKSQQSVSQIDTTNFNSGVIQKTDQVETYTAKTDDTERLRMREEERLMEVERLREIERQRDEEKVREMERLRELERQREEERMMEAERLRLKLEEEKRMEMERVEEVKRLKEEEQRVEEAKRLKEEEQLRLSTQQTSSNILIKDATKQTETIADNLSGQIKSVQSGGSFASVSSSSGGSSSSSGSGFVLSSQYKDNPYLVRFAAQPGTTTYIIGEQQAGVAPVVKSPSLYYLPATPAPTGNILRKENPFLIRYIEQNAGVQAAQDTQSALKEKVSTYATSNSASGFASGASATNFKFNVGATTADVTGLSELEKATRDHFRAHELALEQLRLSNLKNPFHKDC